MEYENSLSVSRDPGVRRYHELTSSRYDECNNAASKVYNPALLEQITAETQSHLAVKVSAALLFQSVCEYPRNIRPYYINDEYAKVFYTNDDFLCSQYTNYSIPTDQSMGHGI